MNRFRAVSVSLMLALGASSALSVVMMRDVLAQESETVTAIEVEGVRRVDPNTVRAYLGFSVGDSLDRARLNSGVKKLYATELFSDVSIRNDGGRVVVNVAENPIVNRVAFEGDDKLKAEDLAKEIQLRSRAVYSRTKIQQDVERLLNLYQRSGRFKASVVPKIIPLESNRVDVVFEIDEGVVTKIKNIFFVGNEIYSASQLRSAVRTEIARWYKFLSSDDTYDPDRIEYDKELLRRYYVERGYADFRVTSAVAELAPEGDGFYITFAVDEGERYQFGDIKVEANLPGVDAAKLQEALKTKSGETYNALLIEDSVDGLSTALGDEGYAFLDVDPKVERDQVNRKVNITYQAAEGPRVYVENINITGNVRTLDEVVRREFRFAEGDPFSASKLKRTEQRLKNLGFFENVKISTVQGSEADRAVVNVEVSEKSTGELSLGAGFSTADGPLVDIGLRENNLLGAGKQLGAKAMIAAERQEIELSYTEPYFLDKPIAAGFDVFKTQQDLRRESSYDKESTGVVVRASYALTEHLTHALNYTIREDIVSDVDPAASLYIKGQVGEYITSSVGHSLTYDTRDNRFEPTEGYFIRLRQDLAGLGGDANYLRNDGRLGVFYSVAPQWVIQAVGNMGYIVGFDDDVRINDRFFMGNRQVRGFTNAGIGPRDVVTRDALGGQWYYSGTLELNFPLGLNSDTPFKGAVFTDFGSLWGAGDLGPGVYDESSLRVSAGVGLSWTSPFGPIRLDFAKALMNESYDETELIKFTFGTRF